MEPRHQNYDLLHIRRKKKHLRIRLFFGLVDVWVKSDGLGIAMFWTQVSKRHIVQENVERRERNP